MTTRLIALAALTALAQLKGADAPAFDVVTVKPTRADAREPIGMFTYAGGRVEITNCTLRAIVEQVYGIDRYLLSGGPKWTDEDRFDMVGKPAAGSDASRFTPKSFKSPPSPEMIEMLKTALADRFRLKVHTETKEGAGYVLVVMPKGAKFGEAKDHEAYSVVTSGVTDDPDLPAFMQGMNASMEKLAARLAQRFRCPVRDQTALRGEFDFKLKFSDEGSLFSAIQEQLGLKLVAAKLPEEHLVIDRAEKPSEN